LWYFNRTKQVTKVINVLYFKTKLQLFNYSIFKSNGDIFFPFKNNLEFFFTWNLGLGAWNLFTFYLKYFLLCVLGHLAFVEVMCLCGECIVFIRNFDVLITFLCP